MKIPKPHALTIRCSIKITHTISMPVRCNGNGAYDWCTFKCGRGFLVYHYYFSENESVFCMGIR